MRPLRGRGMPSKSRQSKRPASRAKPAPQAQRPPARKPPAGRAKTTPPKPAKPVATNPTLKPAAKSAGKPSGGAAPTPSLDVPLPGGRRHVLSLSFVRDGDEFLARLETDSGHITELKNRALDQLLTLVAGELEDLLE